MWPWWSLEPPRPTGRTCAPPCYRPPAPARRAPGTVGNGLHAGRMPRMGSREDEVLERLRAVMDPELGDTIVDLGMVRGVTVSGGDVVVDVALTIAACPLRTQIERDV